MRIIFFVIIIMQSIFDRTITQTSKCGVPNRSSSVSKVSTNIDSVVYYCCEPDKKVLKNKYRALFKFNGPLESVPPTLKNNKKCTQLTKSDEYKQCVTIAKNPSQ